MKRQDDDRAIRVGIWSMLLITAGLCFTVPGCEQLFKAPSTQVSEQKNTAPAQTRQDTAQQGAQYTINVQTHPNGSADRDNATTQPGSVLDELLASSGQSGAKKIRSGGQTNIAIVTIGSSAMTPTQTGSTNGGGSAGQTPTQTPTNSATQEPHSNATGALALGAPGSAPSANASGASEGGNSTANQTNEQRALNQQIKATNDKLDKLVNLLSRQNEPTPPSPESQPAKTEPATQPQE